MGGGRPAADLRRILRESGTTALLVTHDQEEAFAVADRLAVMRDGAVVQQGTTEDVWAHPADPATALFLGYARVLRGAAARVVLAAAGLPAADAVACRRSALAARRTPSSAGPAPGGTSGLAATVVGVRATPDEVRLVVDVDGVGEVDAVGAPGWLPAPGDAVTLRVDPARLAVLPR
jgi:thiamine transport system ATP-binding protein